MKLKKLAALIAIAGLSTSAFATNGYFSHGYGMKAKGMAGVGIALPQDALAAATNPAGITEIGSRLDVGVDYFMPRRGTDIVNSSTGAMTDGSYSGDGDKGFLIPEFGYNRQLANGMAVGLAIYGNGGMNTRYNTSPFANMGSVAPTGINLEQLFIAPTFAMKLNKDHSVGVSLVYGYQRFGAFGLEGFAGWTPSASTAFLTNNGYDKSDGWGLRLGWTGKITENVTLGATYASRMKMDKFGKYKELFAEQGGFDIPENYGFGIAVKATPKLTVAADIQQINYGSVRSVANSVFAPPGTPLGADNGAGFGWRDMTVYKLGASYEYSPNLTLRAGLSTNRQPVPARETMFNILAPGVVENHLTLGATWTMANKSELTVSYMHAFKKTVNGSGSLAPLVNTGEANIRMYQNSLGVGYSIKFD